LAERPPGYDPAHPTEIVCGCHDGTSCYDATAALASQKGETADSGEELLYLSQCACFQESRAGCNTLAHFARDWVAACDRGEEVATSCAIAGFVYRHGVRVPQWSGRSFDADPIAAGRAFDRACKAGAAAACRALATR
jgi:hypothetical protein